MMMIPPVSMFIQSEPIPYFKRPFVSMVMKIEPSAAPIEFPPPPDIAIPPTTQAAIAWNANDLDIFKLDLTLPLCDAGYAKVLGMVQ